MTGAAWHSSGWSSGLLLPALLSGCAAVDTRSATPTFAQAAHVTRDAFATLDRTEQRAFVDLALAQPAGDLRIVPTRECLVGTVAAVPAAAGCRARLLVRGEPVDIGAAGPNLLAAADGLVRYADALAAAAAAGDLEARHQAARQIAVSVGSLAAQAGIPSVQALGSLVADLQQAHDIARRRHALARIAQAVDPAVQALAVLIGDRAGALRANITLARSQALVAAEAEYGAVPAFPDRAVRTRAVIAAVAGVREAASANTDFSSLGRAHRAVVASLEHPRGDPVATLASIDRFGGDAIALQQAFKGEK